MQTAKVLNDVDYTPKNKRMEPENAGFQMSKWNILLQVVRFELSFFVGCVRGSL